MHLIIRPAVFPDDYSAIAQVMYAEMGAYAPDTADLVHADAARDPGLYWKVFVAEQPKLWSIPMVGMASIGHDPRANRVDKLLLDIRVPQSCRAVGLAKPCMPPCLRILRQCRYAKYKQPYGPALIELFVLFMNVTLWKHGDAWTLL